MSPLMQDKLRVWLNFRILQCQFENKADKILHMMLTIFQFSLNYANLGPRGGGLPYETDGDARRLA